MGMVVLASDQDQDSKLFVFCLFVCLFVAGMVKRYVRYSIDLPRKFKECFLLPNNS